MTLWSDLRKWVLRRGKRRRMAPLSATADRVPVDHILILDGTMSRLDNGDESNAGRTWRLLSGMGRRPDVSLYYEQGIQWRGWRYALDIVMGRGINRQIRRAYGYLATRYRPGDRIILIGYSRGAFAVRSLAGLIGRVGLLRPEHATERLVGTAYRHYERGAGDAASRAFHDTYCHDEVLIEMIGVWDTVKALGLRPPLIWPILQARHAFHDHILGQNVLHGFHALALDERRLIYAPEMWDTSARGDDRIQQVWFRGVHGDIGGHLLGDERARPLANLPLVWMLEQMERCGITLPEGWHEGLICDVTAPSVGLNRGAGKFLRMRAARMVGVDASEALHPSLFGR